MRRICAPRVGRAITPASRQRPGPRARRSRTTVVPNTAKTITEVSAMSASVLPLPQLRTQAFIGGSFTPAADGRTFGAVSPRDGSVLGEVARCGSEDVDRAVRAARDAHTRGAWAFADPAERGRVLIQLAQLMLDRIGPLAQIEARD